MTFPNAIFPAKFVVIKLEKVGGGLWGIGETFPAFS
jgi:hypothetical protein